MDDLPLRDIHLTPSIFWWPLAMGWWLSFILIVVCIFLSFFIFRKWKKSSLKKEAVLALNLIEQQFQQNKDIAWCVREISSFLRRCTISKQALAASLTGPAWLHFLDEQTSSKDFSEGAGRILLNGPYQRYVDAREVSSLFQLCRNYIKTL